MWTPVARQLQRVCAPLLHTIAQRLPAVTTNTIASVGPTTIWQRSCHLLAVSMMRRPLAAAGSLAAQRIVAPTALGQCAAGAVCAGAVTPQLQQTAGFKLKRVLKRRCKDCYFVVREDRMHIICKTHPRHKQMAIKKPAKSTWILTHATQSPVRPW